MSTSVSCWYFITISGGMYFVVPQNIGGALLFACVWIDHPKSQIFTSFSWFIRMFPGYSQLIIEWAHFDVAVDDVQLVQVVHSRQYLVEDVERLVLVQRALPRQEVLQVPLRAELQHDVDVRLVLEHLLDRQDVPVREFRLDLDLVRDVRHRVDLRDVRFVQLQGCLKNHYNLHRVRVPRRGVLDLDHVPERTCPQELLLGLLVRLSRASVLDGGFVHHYNNYLL